MSRTVLAIARDVVDAALHRFGDQAAVDAERLVGKQPSRAGLRAVSADADLRPCLVGALMAEIEALPTVARAARTPRQGPQLDLFTQKLGSPARRNPPPHRGASGE